MSVESATAKTDVEEPAAKLSNTMMSALGNQQREQLLRQVDRLKQDLNEKFMQHISEPRPEDQQQHQEGTQWSKSSMLS